MKLFIHWIAVFKISAYSAQFYVLVSILKQLGL